MVICVCYHFSSPFSFQYHGNSYHVVGTVKVKTISWGTNHELSEDRLDDYFFGSRALGLLSRFKSRKPKTRETNEMISNSHFNGLNTKKASIDHLGNQLTSLPNANITGAEIKTLQKKPFLSLGNENKLAMYIILSWDLSSSLWIDILFSSSMPNNKRQNQKQEKVLQENVSGLSLMIHPKSRRE